MKKFFKEKRMKHESITLGGGCFWCLEAIFSQIQGVMEVVSGYAGGNVENPSYEQVCRGTTHHAEVVQITFDTTVISFEEILKIFWLIHDPTTLNAQGNDVGTQYRSVIFYHDEKQKQTAEVSMKIASQAFIKLIVTEVLPLPHFYEAEAYHQHYFQNNPHQGYCTFVIAPKLQHFKEVYEKRVH